MQQLPRTTGGRVQLVAAGILVLLAFMGSAAARIHGAVAETAPSTVTVTEPAPARATVTDPAPAGPATTAGDTATTGFTLGDLAAGRVPQDVQDRFWQAQLDAIVAAPCPERAGGTAVTLFLGADEAWTARLREATESHAAACAA